MDDRTSRLTVTRVGKNSLIIKQKGDRGFFISSDNVIVIGVDALAFLLKFLVANKFLSRKVLEGILSEVTE